MLKFELHNVTLEDIKAMSAEDLKDMTYDQLRELDQHLALKTIFPVPVMIRKEIYAKGTRTQLRRDYY